MIKSATQRGFASTASEGRRINRSVPVSAFWHVKSGHVGTDALRMNVQQLAAFYHLHDRGHSACPWLNALPMNQVITLQQRASYALVQSRMCKPSSAPVAIAAPPLSDFTSGPPNAVLFDTIARRRSKLIHAFTNWRYALALLPLSMVRL